MKLPETLYADTGTLRLAYQKWGSGPPLLIVPALVSNVEIQWEHETYRRVREHVGNHMTCVDFDKRGIGLSDRFDEPPPLETRIEDMLCVMDTVGWEKASIFGVSEGGAMAQLFAADYPERVDKLVLLNTFVSPRYRRELSRYSDVRMLSERMLFEKFMGLVEAWSVDPRYMVDWEMPSQSDNESFIRWIGRLQRFSASPKDFRRQMESVWLLDAGDAPERITAPTMVMHVTGDQVLPVAGGRMLAELIPNAEYVEIRGKDHFAWIMPHWREFIDQSLEFLTGKPVEARSQRKFGTVLFTDIVDSTRQSSAVGDERWHEVLDNHDRITRRLIDDHGGRVVKSTGDGLLAVFETPSQGVECGLALRDGLAAIGLDIRAGVHAGEVEAHESGDISGIAVNLASRVEHAAGAGELWASSTIRDLMLGGSLKFDERGEHALKGIEGMWRLFAVNPS